MNFHFAFFVAIYFHIVWMKCKQCSLHFTGIFGGFIKRFKQTQIFPFNSYTLIFSSGIFSTEALTLSKLLVNVYSLHGVQNTYWKSRHVMWVSNAVKTWKLVNSCFGHILTFCLFLIFVTETISRTDESQPRPEYIFNKCETNIYFFLLYRGLVHHHHRILKLSSFYLYLS